MKIFNVKAHKAVLKYEQTWLNSELSIRCLKVSSFRHDISNYAQRLAKREAVATYSGKPRVCIWLPDKWEAASALLGAIASLLAKIINFNFRQKTS